MLRTARLVVLPAALLLAAGCGGSSPEKSASSGSPTASSSATAPSSTSASATPVPPEDEPAAAALTAYLNAFATENAAQVCSLQTPAFSAFQVERAVQTKFLTKGATCVQLVDKALVEAKKHGGNLKALATSKLSLIEGSSTKVKLRVDYTASTASVPEAYTVVDVGGRWLVDSNENLPSR